jgi:hypothetical protein
MAVKFQHVSETGAEGNDVLIIADGRSRESPGPGTVVGGPLRHGGEHDFEIQQLSGDSL